MSKRILYVLVGALIFYFSCAAQPASTGDGSGDSGGSSSSTSGIVVNENNPSETLETVPELKLKLKDMPDSLSDNNLKLKSPRFKAVGDVTTLDPATLPDVKSSAWNELVKTLQNGSTAQQMLTSLKEMANYYQFSLNQTTDLREGYKVYCTTDGKGGIAYYFTIDMSLLEEPQGLSKKNLALIKKAMQKQSGYTIQMKMYIDVYPTNGKAAVEFIADYLYIDEGVTNNYRMYSYYNEDSGEIIDSMDFSGYTFLWRAWWDSPTSMAIVTYYGGEGYNSLSIAWGNNDYGGVIQRYGEESYKYIYTEYYNNNGGLVYQGYGNNDNSQMDFSFYEENGANIASFFISGQPSKIDYMYEYWYEVNPPNNYGYNTYVSNNSGWQSLGGDFWYLYYKTNPSAWSSGDCVYFYDSWLRSTNFEQNGTNYFRDYYSYIKGLEIPTLQAYLGDNYYFYNYWPLKYLTLDDAYSNYQITRSNTYEYSYTNEWTWEDSNYTYVYTWTSYDWWLDKDRDTVYSNGVDININGVLEEQDVYLWDDTLGIIAPQKEVFAYGTADKPLYFKFTGGSIVSNVKDKIEWLYTNTAEQNLIDFITNRQIPNPHLFPTL